MQSASAFAYCKPWTINIKDLRPHFCVVRGNCKLDAKPRVIRLEIGYHAWMSTPYAYAIRLLARREHSAAELHRKLGTRDWGEEEVSDEDIDELILSLQQEGLQSDERYAESYANQRINKGYGPLRIDNELRERGVSENIRALCLAEHEERWWDLMQQVREKKYGADLPDEYTERAKQMRFLQYRGFVPENIRELLS